MLTVELSQFMYDKATRQLSVEVSCLDELMHVIPFQFAVRSQHTGKTAVFTKVAKAMDRDGDTIKWLFRNEETNLNLVLFND